MMSLNTKISIFHLLIVVFYQSDLVQHNKEIIQPEHNNINLLKCRSVIDLHSQLVAVAPSSFSLQYLNCNDLAKIPVSRTRIPYQDQDKMASISNITYSIQALRMIGKLTKLCYTQFHLFKAIHRRITQCNNDLMD